MNFNARSWQGSLIIRGYLEGSKKRSYHWYNKGDSEIADGDDIG